MKHSISHYYKIAHWIADGLALLFFIGCNIQIALAQEDFKLTLPAPAQAALDSAQKIQRLPLDQLTPFSNGPGVVIASPSSTASTDDSLGRGAARWLQWTLGGLPAFDKNASWQSFTESISYLQRHKINSEAEAAAILSVNSGATNVAMGALTGDGKQLSLSYQWHKFPGNQLIDKPVSISGSPAEIVIQLPQLAEKLAAQLNVKSTFIAPTESVAQLQALGNLPLSPDTNLPDADVASLIQLATVSNPARMMYLTYLVNSNYDGTYPSHQTQVQWQQTATDLLKNSPSNTLAWQYIAKTNDGNLWGNEAKLITLGKANPHNYLLSQALAYTYGSQGDLQQRRDSSQNALRCNQQNPRAWTQLADTIFNEADNVRHASYWSSMNVDQQAFVSDRYEECVPFLQAAAILPHHSASTWANISRTATFAGDEDLIKMAMQKALEADPISEDALRWAIQVYQPKWGGTPDELLPVVKRVVASPHLYVRMFKNVNQAIYASGFAKGTEASQEEVKRVLETWLKEHPHDYAARSSYGTLLWQLKDLPGMKAQEEILIKERPNDSLGYWMRASRFYGLQQYAYAGDYYKKAIEHDPDNAKLHYNLGETYHMRGQYQGEKELYPQARDEYELSIKEDPLDKQYTGAYNRLGDLYIYVFNDPKKAVELYSQAASLFLDEGLYWANLGHAYFLLGQKEISLEAGIHARQVGYSGQHPLWGELQSMVKEK